MFNPFNVFLKPQSVVGLEITNRFIKAVRVTKSSKGPEIDHIAIREVEGAEQLHTELRDFFHQEHLSHDMLITCLPSSKALVRQIKVQFDNLKKLNKIIKYQMEPYVPQPIDDMVVDYMPPKSNGDVITVGVTKKILSEHLEILSLADLEPKVVGLEEAALLYLYLNDYREKDDRAVAIINLGSEKQGVLVIYQNRPEFLRILPGGPARVEGLIQTFNLFRLKSPDVPLDEILLTGNMEDSVGLAEALESHMKIKTSLWRPFDKIQRRIGDIGGDLQTKLSVPLGLALSLINPSPKVFNLRQEEFIVQDNLHPKRVSFWVVSFVLILGLFTFNLFYNRYLKEKRYTQLQEKTRQLVIGAFPGASKIIKGRELTQFSQMIEVEMGKYRWLEGLSSHGTVLDILKALTNSIQSFPDVKIDNLSIEGKEIRLDGHTSSFETVDSLEKKLKATGSLKMIKLVGAKMEKDEQTVKFNFAIEKDK